MALPPFSPKVIVERQPWSMNPALACDLAFYALWLFVLTVSVFDTLLTIRFSEQMMVGELNPMGRALLHLNSGEVTYMIVVKALGTILAASIVLMLHWRSRRLGLTVVGGLATFQFALLLFLTLT